MKILTATRVAALAVGLSFAGGHAFADPSDGRGDRNKDNSAPQSQNNDNQAARDTKHKNQKPAEQSGQQIPAAKPMDRAGPQNARNRGAYQNRGNDNQRKAEDNNRRNNPPVLRNTTNDREPAAGTQRTRNVDVTRYHRNFNAPRRFRVDSYRQPYGYSYRRWSYGQRLPRDYYARDFWLTNFLIYGLLSPPPGYVWVRYGPDALLIDEETGEIVQVQYNMFYT